jgi:hypothetical protein
MKCVDYVTGDLLLDYFSNLTFYFYYLWGHSIIRDTLGGGDAIVSRNDTRGRGGGFQKCHQTDFFTVIDVKIICHVTPGGGSLHCHQITQIGGG